MEGVKSLEVQPRWTPRRRGLGTFVWWRRELGRPSPARWFCGGSPECSGPITGDEPGSGREPGGSRRRPYYCLSRSDNITVGEGRAAASFTRHAQGRAGECHIVARTIEQDTVRELQRTLYRAAKADPGR